MVERARRSRDLEHLVDLLLIARHHHARAAMLKHIGDLVAHRVGIERHRHGARPHRGNHRPVERRAVAADHRDVVALADPEVEQPERQRRDLGVRLGPGPALPDAELFLAIGGAAAEAHRVSRHERGDRFGHGFCRGPVRHPRPPLQAPACVPRIVRPDHSPGTRPCKRGVVPEGQARRLAFGGYAASAQQPPRHFGAGLHQRCSAGALRLLMPGCPLPEASSTWTKCCQMPLRAR